MLAFLLLVVLMASAYAQETGLALVGGTIYVSPTQRPKRNGVVLIRDGKIAAVGSRAECCLPTNASRQ